MAFAFGVILVEWKGGENIRLTLGEAVQDLIFARASLNKDFVNRTRNGTCVDRVVLVLRKEQNMYEGATCALKLERATTSVRRKMG